MNQILVTENKKKNKNRNGNRNNNSLSINRIVLFFAIIIMIFGVTLIGEGSYAFYRRAQDYKPENIPSVTIGRVNDKAVVYVTNNLEISQLKYSWDNGEETEIPVNAPSTQEEITLLGYNSTLHLTVEDINGKRVSYQKQYILDGVDITKPTIQVDTQNGNELMKIIATDETAISYITYNWEGEEKNTIYAEQQDQKQIVENVRLTPGTKTINILAEDRNGNVELFTQKIVATTSKPHMTIKYQAKNKITILVTDSDGIKDIVVNLNGQKLAARDLNKKENKKEIEVGPLTLKEGSNTISISVTNVSGYNETANTELQYTP